MTWVQLWLQADRISWFLYLQSVELYETKIYMFLLLTLYIEKSVFHREPDLGVPVDEWSAMLEKLLR